MSFRKIADTSHEQRSDVSMRLANLEDLDVIAAIDEDFFGDEDTERSFCRI